MRRSELELDSSDGEERLRRLSISVVRTLWGDHDGGCPNKSCPICLAKAGEDEKKEQHRRLSHHRPLYDASDPTWEELERARKVDIDT